MEGASAVLLAVLRQRLGDIPQDAYDKISNMSFSDMESLTERLFDFSTFSDLQDWLDNTKCRSNF